VPDDEERAKYLPTLAEIERMKAEIKAEGLQKKRLSYSENNPENHIVYAPKVYRTPDTWGE